MPDQKLVHTLVHNGNDEPAAAPHLVRQVWEKPHLARLGADSAENGGDNAPDGVDSLTNS
jgi:hypothetical protein